MNVQPASMATPIALSAAASSTSPYMPGESTIAPKPTAGTSNPPRVRVGSDWVRSLRHARSVGLRPWHDQDLFPERFGVSAYQRPDVPAGPAHACHGGPGG